MIYVILIMLILFLFLCKKTEGVENVSAPDTKSTEAIQNLASMYNDQHLKTSKIQLGGKWLLSGVGDGYGNDDWLRLNGIDGKTYNGGFAANKLWTSEIHGNPTSSLGNTTINGKVTIEGPELEVKKDLRVHGGLKYNPVCRIVQTGDRNMGSQNSLVYLDRAFGDHTLTACNENEYISGIKYTGNGNVHLKCCRIGS